MQLVEEVLAAQIRDYRNHVGDRKSPDWPSEQNRMMLDRPEAAHQKIAGFASNAKKQHVG